MEVVNKELKKYYRYLKEAKADVPPTYESFEKTLSDENNARDYYKYLREAKFDAPDTYESFSETLGLKKKVATDYVYPTSKAFTNIFSKVAGDIPKLETGSKDISQEVIPTKEVEEITPLQYPHWTDVSKALGIPLSKEIEAISKETGIELRKLGEPEIVGGVKPVKEEKKIPSLQEIKDRVPPAESIQPSDKTIAKIDTRESYVFTVEDYLKKRGVLPETVGLDPDVNTDRFIDVEERIDFDKKLEARGLYSPRPQYRESYIGALASGVNKGTAQLIRDIGYLLIDVPLQTKKSFFEAGAKIESKIKGYDSETTQKYIEQVASAIDRGMYGNVISTTLKEGYEESAKWLEELTKTRTPDAPWGRALENVGAFIPDIIGIGLLPQSKAPLLVKWGLQGMLKFPAYLGVKTYVEGAKEGKPLKEIIATSTESAAQGMTFNGLGVWSHEIGNIAKSIGAGLWTSKGASVLANSLGFGAIVKGGGGDVREGFLEGLAFSALGAPEAIRQGMQKKAMVNWMTATDNNIRMIAESKIDPFKLREESIRLFEESQKAPEGEQRDRLLWQKNIVDNTIDIAFITNQILKNPDGFIKSINENPMLSAREKKIWTNKVNNTINMVDPRILESQQISEKIKSLENEFNYWKEKADVDPEIKTSKVEALQNQIKEQKEARIDIFSKPLEDYAPKQEKVSEKAPERPLAEEKALEEVKPMEVKEEKPIEPEVRPKEVIEEKPAEPKIEPKPETPEEARIRINDRLVGLVKDYNDIPKSYSKKRAAVMRSIQGLLVQTDYKLETKGTEISLKGSKGKKVIRVAEKGDNQRLEDIADPGQRAFITTMVNAREYLYDLDFPIGGEALDKAVSDLIAGKSNQNTQYVINSLSDMYKRGAYKFKGEQQPEREIPIKEGTDLIKDDKLRAFVEKYGDITLENIDKAAELGLIDKNDLKTFKTYFENENRERIREKQEWAAEEVRIAAEGEAISGGPAPPEGKGMGRGGEGKEPKEVKPEIKPDEEPIYRPDIETGKKAEDIVPGGAEAGKEPVVPKGEEKPIAKYTPGQQEAIDKINKEYDKEIADRQKELDNIPDQIERAVNKANKRIGLFGDLKPLEPDEIIKREEQGFEVTSETVKAIRKPFEERTAELIKEIDALNKERESKIGELLKQQVISFGEEPLEEKPPETVVETDMARRQEIMNSIREGEMILQSGKKVSGEKMTPEELDIVRRSVARDKSKLGEPKPEAPKEIKVTKEGVKYGEKTYTKISEVQDDFANKKLTIDEQRDLSEQVRRYEDRQNGIEPLTDKPEELAWDEPLPLKAGEDPNFKNSDLNNAMSIRNLARNLIKNMGLEEGADIRTGFIERFARKARGIFNPVSGIIRVNNIRDLRALTHEIGHKLDFEMFDIRGIVGARKGDPQLGVGVDFNGKMYSNVVQVEKAMKERTITIDEGNFLLDKVKKFEKKKLGEKYAEIIEQGTPLAVKYKGKSYKSVKEINDALAKGLFPTTKASELIIKFNATNKNITQKLDKLRLKYGDDVVAGVLQRTVLKKEFRQLLRDSDYPSEKREEGIAEFVYNYVIDPKQVINSTPNALAWFERLLDNAPEVKNALHKLREEFAKYDAQDIKTKMAAEMMPPEPKKLSWLDTIVKIGTDPLYNMVNMLRPLEKMSEKWKKMMDNNVLAYKDPWISAKQLLGQGGRSEQWILYHPYFNRGNDVIIREDIKGVMAILKPIIGTTDYLPYQTYMVALDAIESHNREKPEQAYFDKETALAGKAAFEKQYGVQKLWDFQKDIQKYNETLLDFAAESGIISKETADHWKQEHQYYVPLRRIAETYEIMGGRKKTITRDLLPEAEKAIFSRKGSQKQIRDIFESMIENTNHILASSERNLLNRNLADMFFDIHNYNKSHNKGGAVIEEIDGRGMEAYQDPTTGEIRYAIAKVRPKNFRPPKGRILVVKEEGNPRFYDVAPEYYDDIFRVTNQTAKEVSNIMKILSAPSHWLQAGAVVYDPTFPVRNIFRDQTSTWFTSKHGYLPTDFLRGIFSAVKKNEYYQKWLASGGDQSFLISADQAISNNYFDKKLGKFARRKFDAYMRNPLLALQDFSKASEIGSRLGAFKNAYKKTGNVRLAAIESRDITADYGIHGAVTRQFFQLFPFLNARIQWARTIVNSMKNPASFMLKGMALTMPAAINWLINNQDEESRALYQSLSTWRRVGMFNIRIPGTDHFLPLPKGFYGVLFASSIESLLDEVAKDDPRVLKELPQQLFREISPISNWPEIIPFIGRPLIEAWANKSGYTGKPIISESMKLLTPSEQFYNSTPEIIKKMGEALNWSPVKINHYVKSYTGGAGMGAVNILDETLAAIGLVEKKPEDTFTKLSRMPLLKAFLTEKPIGLYSSYISDFYETLDKIEKVNVTFNNFVKTENMDGLEKFMADPENKRMYSFYEGNSTALNSFRNALTFARDGMYAIMRDDLMDNKEKQDAVQSINEIIQESALKFKDAYDNRKFFEYGKVMDEIITKMKEEKKDYRRELVQQQNVYNLYWIQLREQNKDVYERLREFGGLREIEQTRSLIQGSKKISLELEDVRRFNEIVVKRYGENVKNMIGVDRKRYESYQGISIPTPASPDLTRLQQLLNSAWDKALLHTNSNFKPTYTNEK